MSDGKPRISLLTQQVGETRVTVQRDRVPVLRLRWLTYSTADEMDTFVVAVNFLRAGVPAVQLVRKWWKAGESGIRADERNFLKALAQEGEAFIVTEKATADSEGVPDEKLIILTITREDEADIVEYEPRECKDGMLLAIWIECKECGKLIALPLKTRRGTKFRCGGCNTVGILEHPYEVAD